MRVRSVLLFLSIPLLVKLRFVEILDSERRELIRGLGILQYNLMLLSSKKVLSNSYVFPSRARPFSILRPVWALRFSKVSQRPYALGLGYLRAEGAMPGNLESFAAVCNVPVGQEARAFFSKT